MQIRTDMSCACTWMNPFWCALLYVLRRKKSLETETLVINYNIMCKCWKLGEFIRMTWRDANALLMLDGTFVFWVRDWPFIVVVQPEWQTVPFILLILFSVTPHQLEHLILEPCKEQRGSSHGLSVWCTQSTVLAVQNLTGTFLLSSPSLLDGQDPKRARHSLKVRKTSTQMVGNCTGAPERNDKGIWCRVHHKSSLYSHWLIREPFLQQYKAIQHSCCCFSLSLPLHISSLFQLAPDVIKM